MRVNPPSLRRRLVMQLLALSAVLSVLMYLSVRIGADRASEATLDAVLGAAALAMAEEMRSGDGGAVVDLSPVTFSMLAAMGEERIFYRVDLNGKTLTGYDDLPAPDATPTALSPIYYTAGFRGSELRVAAVARSLMIDNQVAPLTVLLGQTREGQKAIATRLANRAAGLGLIIFLLAVPLSLLAAGSLLRPIGRLSEAVGRRGPRDLRPIRHPAPAELAPFVTALNGFIGRLRGTLLQTETFIAEAAHHIRTPLSIMRNEAELALRHTTEDGTRTRLRSLIRSVDDSARSAGQLLDHATVLYRADQKALAALDLVPLAQALVDRFAPMADMKDMTLRLTLPDRSLMVLGDVVLVEAALRNILDNAVKYSPQDSEVSLDAKVEANRVILTVNDRGRGLSTAKTDSIRTRFQRGSNVDDVPGSGLGLTIVDEAAAAMGGQFTLIPREGGGTCATLSLPLLP